MDFAQDAGEVVCGGVDVVFDLSEQPRIIPVDAFGQVAFCKCRQHLRHVTQALLAHVHQLVHAGGEIQEEAGGIAQAIGLAGEFADNEKILVILGDNIFNQSLKRDVEEFEKKEKGAVVYGKRMATKSKQYGVIEVKNSKVISIEEKPEKPKSDIGQTGIYMYDHRVFNLIRKLKPSTRGELEVTDLNNFYVKEGTMICKILTSWWVDAGTSFDELLRANVLVAKEISKEK